MAKTIYKPRFCGGCGAEYVPSSANQKVCPHCRATANTEHRAAYNTSPETKARIAARRKSPDGQARIAAYRASTGARAYHAAYYVAHKEEAAKADAARRAALRLGAFNAYGGPVCVCCGEKHPEFLCLDHVNGDGAAHRRKIGRSTTYSWLKKNNYPAGFQVLCYNCNWAKGTGDHCPHRDIREIEDIAAGRIAWG